jgi:hypothetical protein
MILARVGGAACRRGDRTTKLTPASPSGGELCCGPKGELFAGPVALAKQIYRRDEG